MNHEGTGDTISTVCGAALALVIRALTSIDLATVSAELLHAAVLGAIGGISGFMAKRAIERHMNRKTKDQDAK